MPGSSRNLLEAGRRLVVRTSAGRLRGAWLALYGAAGRVAARRLARRYDAEVVLRGAGATGAFAPGLSDIDLLAIAPAGSALPRPPRERLFGGLVQADVYRADDLAAILGATALTFGLETRAASYHGRALPGDPTGLLDRPGIPPEALRWRRLAGPRRAPRVPAADRDALLVAAWLELVTWWRFALEALAVEQRAPTDAYLCVKLVAEPLRVLLALDGETVTGRHDALVRGERRVPELAAEVGRARELLARLPEGPEAPLAETLPVLVALSERVAQRIGEELRPGARVSLAGDRERLPLVDWRALVAEPLPGLHLYPLAGDAGCLADLRGACAHGGEGVPVLRTAGLVVQPTADPWYAGRLRTLQAPFVDPVTFALLDGADAAVFPAARGLCAGDWARRAVAERSAWLAAAGGPQGQPAGWRRPPDAAEATPRAAQHLLGTLRAALFALSLADGEPLLLLDAEAVAARAGGAAAEVAAALAAGEAAAAPAVAALRREVGGLLERARELHARR